MNSDLSIRKANIEDVSLILSFIKDLAVYEKLLHEAVVSEEDLKKTLFGVEPYAKVILGFYENAPAAFAIYFTNYSTFLGKPGLYLEDLFVKPEYRAKGFGKQMLSYLAGIARDNNYGRFEWSVLDWNEPAIRFYKSLGAAPMNEWTVFRLDEKGIKELAGEAARL